MYPLARASDPSSPPAGILMMGLNLRRRIRVYDTENKTRLRRTPSGWSRIQCDDEFILSSRTTKRNGRGSRRAAPVRLRTQSTALIDRDSGTNPPLRARTGGSIKRDTRASVTL